MCEHLKAGNRLGIFFVLVFLLSYAWYFIHPVHPQLQLQLFEAFFFGFTGFGLMSVVAGVVQSYIWGYVAMLFLCIACCCKRGCPWCKKCSCPDGTCSRCCCRKTKDEIRKQP